MAMTEMLFNPTMSNLGLSLKEAARRQAIIANNIANADTPGYQAMSFSQALMTAENQLAAAPLIENSPAAGPAGVVLEDQMAKMAENSLFYTSCIRLMNYEFKLYQHIVTQGRQ